MKMFWNVFYHKKILKRSWSKWKLILKMKNSNSLKKKKRLLQNWKPTNLLIWKTKNGMLLFFNFPKPDQNKNKHNSCYLVNYTYEQVSNFYLFYSQTLMFHVCFLETDSTDEKELKKSWKNYKMKYKRKTKTMNKFTKNAKNYNNRSQQ